MAQKTMCKQLKVMQEIKGGCLGGPYDVSLQLSNDLTVSVNQYVARTIKLVSKNEVECSALFDMFETVEKLLMLFDGRFIPIKSVCFEDGENGAPQLLEAVKNKIMSERLDYYVSKDFCQYFSLSLIPYQKVLSKEIYTKWEALLAETGIVYQVFLYSISDNKMPVDINFAFLVELAEPFVELVKEKTYFCATLSPGEKGTTLKMCIDALVTHFGKDIFKEELNNDYDTFLDRMVGSRVRIMHIKKNKKEYFDEKNCVRYSKKLILLYRKIFFELLGIKSDIYDSALKHAINKIDKGYRGQP